MTGPRLKFAAALLVVVALGVLATLLPVRVYLTSTLQWMRGLGFWAPAALVVAYVLASLLFVPGLLLSIGAGFLFGLVPGTITVSIGSTLGASAAFLLGRRLVRDSVRDMTAGNPKFASLARAVGREGFKIVLLARLSPLLPYNLLNYALGLTPIRFRDFALASWIGMLPATMVYVYLGSTLADLAEIGTAGPRSSWARTLLSALGLSATVVIFVLMARTARRALREAVDEANQPGNDVPC